MSLGIVIWFARRTVALGAMAALAVGIALLASPKAEAGSRIKDIAEFEGVRENLLIGYGLVVGLNGTGDRLANAAFTQQSLVSMLERLGVNTRDANLNTRNVAAVMVTATLPPFARHGARIDVTASALGDATNLLGGTLLVTPLLGADGEVYAVAQGQLAVSGFTVKGDSGSSITKGVPTSARIANGAIIERELGFELRELGAIHIAMRNPDFTTASRVADAINQHLGANAAYATDPGTVLLNIPDGYRTRTAEILTEIEQITVEPDAIARVVIDETSGVIVMGENVRIDTVAIAHGNLTIRIAETPQVSQPGAFAPEGAQTTEVDRSNITIDESNDRRLAVMRAGISIQELVSGLNALGIGPRDLITILQTIKTAGALHADIQVF
ncbi:MAG: flagellar basal body P-ring protein FlgI [Alphaproteobacteria bacterium]|nr:flagellar basal body P-ring protein FlgI [Alphaproteobacteria bacterium]